MTPPLAAEQLGLPDNLYPLLVKDFLSGTFHFIYETYGITTLDAYFESAKSIYNVLSTDQVDKLGRRLPSYRRFRRTHPEYFL